MLEPSLPGGQTHMLNEIREQPAALQRTLSSTASSVRQAALEAKQRQVNLVILAARGTSDHAALYAQYLFQYLNGIPVALATPSLYTLYGASLRLGRTLVIGISQSGESTDIVEVVAQARQAGALTVGITNQEGSQLARTAQHTLLCHAGFERSVAATKTYTTTCAVLAMLAAFLPGGELLRDSIEQIPELVTAALKSEEVVAHVAERYVHARDCVVLGRVFQYSTARETALKLEETCYVVATPFSSADFRHGPAALVDRGLPVIVFAPPGRTSSDSHELLQWLRERGADCLVVTEDERLQELATTCIRLELPTPTTSVVRKTSGTVGGNDPAKEVQTSIAELLAPLPYIIPGQLFAHYLALYKGLNPDQPRSLTKITRTR
ncbi:MAG: SIS domain-containing protein [Ktedonobacteraceae bacterium]